MKTISLKVKKSDTVQKARAAFSEVEGVSKVHLKKLFFGGQCLDKDKKLVDYEIKNGSIINMFLDSGVRTLIHVKMPQLGKTIELNVDIRDTVHTIKGKILNKEGIAATGHDIIYLGEVLKDSEFLASYTIQEGSTLYAIFQFGDAVQVNVGVEQGTRTVNVKVKRWYKVVDLKNMIESMEGTPTNKQRIYLNDVELDDNVILADLHISQEQVLNLVSGMRVRVQTMTGMIHIVELVDSSATATIRDLKEMVMEKDGTPPERQRLIFSGMQMEDHRLLSYYKIEDDTLVYLVLCLCGC